MQHPGAVAIVPIDNEDTCSSYASTGTLPDSPSWSSPGESVESGESPDDTAQRELREETGYASQNLRALGGVYSSPGFCTEFLYLYIARDLVPSRLPGDEDEDISVETVPMSRVDRLIRLGEIQDAKTVAGLLMARYLFK